MRIARHLSELIGNTPLVELNSVVPEGAGRVVAKIEYLNPGGSSKDRIAVKMIEEAERTGKLLPGGTIVEPTSGNTGVGLALVAQQKGYRCIFVVPDKVGEDKRAVLQAYGAEVVVTPTAVAPTARRATTASRTASSPRFPAPTSPTSSPTRPPRPATTSPPGRRSGATRTAASRTA